MTASDRSIPEDVYQSFCRLRDSVDGFSAVARLIPDGESDVFDFASLGHLLRMVPTLFMAVLMFTGVLSLMLNSSNAKSWGPAGLPVGSDLVIDDTQERYP
ncbi:TPA: hypothetical protein JWW44_004847 [Escherichia coli]|uniref:hypothetical protein n=1 Tax=Escherichia coli TaxID=562 RepID=UPI0015E83331|nr:hypothetical protein [Escherichia coli]EHW2955215.1 hypothetical protein [Escherichia coli]EIN7428512.1 hypothetical protein [Escherichia coli]EJJ5496427.1 hypothetical protein [Escherichia coli]HAX2930648.1 hypothetical protein [Escherichia coli]HAX3234993.1 hypothetical protein [Escherichia coli]